MLPLLGCLAQGNERIIKAKDLQINVKTYGKDGLVVLFENGMGSSLDAWGSIPDSIADFAIAYSYDRAGLGNSEISAAKRTIPNMVNELREVLQQEKLSPPYIYVAHSMGSYLARYFALHYPEEIAALLLVDPSPDRLYDDYSDKEYKEFQNFGNDSYAESNIGVKREWENYLNNRKYVQNDSISNQIPMVIISASQWDFSSYHSDMMNKNRYSKHLKVEGSHDIHQEKPSLIIDLIKELIRTAE